MLGLTSFCVQRRPGEAALARGYFWGIFVFRWGYFSKTGGFNEMALTDTEIKRAKVTEKAYSLNDAGGLYLWITPDGGKLWRWAYRFNRKEKLMSLGKYPAVSLALARERHGEARQLLASGVDPMAQRKAGRTEEKIASENSFQSVAALWLEHWQDGKSPRHVDSVRRRMAADILPCMTLAAIASWVVWPVGEDVALLAHTVGAVTGLRFGGRVPPGGEDEDVIGGGQVQAQATGFEADQK